MKTKVKMLEKFMRLVTIIMVAVLLVTMTNIDTQAATTKKKNVVVLYFSGTGTTRAVAKKIQKSTKGKLVEIKAAKKYTAADLDYTNPNSRVCREHNSASSPMVSKVRPRISNINQIRAAVKKADIVYIGYPIWWGEAPNIMYTMIGNVNLRGKIVTPFCTSASSGTGRSGRHLKSRAKISKNTKWYNGKSFYGVPSQKTVNNWVKKVK